MKHPLGLESAEAGAVLPKGWAQAARGLSQPLMDLLTLLSEAANSSTVSSGS